MWSQKKTLRVNDRSNLALTSTLLNSNLSSLNNFIILIIFWFILRSKGDDTMMVTMMLKNLYCIRAPPRGGRFWEIHPRRLISRDPRDFTRAKPDGNLEGRGKSERFSEAVGFAPRDPRDFPRAKPEGNPKGRGVQNPRPRKISRAEGMDFPISPESWWSTDILSSLPGKD